MEALCSDIFGALEWDMSCPEFPNANGKWIGCGGKTLAVSLVGRRNLTDWTSFLRESESTALRLAKCYPQIMDDTARGMKELSIDYFGRELVYSGNRLAEIAAPYAFYQYDDLGPHLWLETGPDCNYLDIDIELTRDLEFVRARFDG